MRLRKGTKIGLITLAIAYGVYVGGTALFLNTSLFSKVADMENEDQTYVKLHGAISPFPGFLYVSSGRVFISDQNVSIGIDLNNIKVGFSILPLLRKRLEIESLHVHGAKVNLGMKTTEESVEFQKKYLKPEDLDLKKRIEKVKEFETSHLTLNFKQIQIDTISEVKSDLGDFSGNLALTGAFMIQPKVQVEVFPTTLKFYSGQIPGQVSSLEGEAKVAINRFRMIDAPGNAVFPFFNADLKLDATLKSLKVLDLTLRKLPGYAFEGGDTRLSVRAQVKDGLLEKGSTITSLPSELSIHTPGLKAQGFGHIEWKVDSAKTSRLNGNLKDVKILNGSDAVLAGTIKSLNLEVKLFGTELVDAFHGLKALLRLHSLRWTIHSGKKNPNLNYSGDLTGDGTLSAYTGDLPESEKIASTSATHLKLNIEKLELNTSFLPDLNGTGTIEIHTDPVNLGENSIHFPKFDVALDLNVKKYGEVKSRANFKNLEYHLYPSESWKGQLEWTLDQTAPLVKAMVDRGQISGFLGAVANVKDFVIKADCEVGPSYSWLRFNEVNSSGIWKAYGTLTNQDEGLKGIFEARVFNLPIGIRIMPDKTDIRFLPSSHWYDETRSDLPTPVQ